MALTDNVVAVYEFNESSGTTAADATGGGKTLVNFNGVAWVAGKLGNCIDIEKDSLQYFQRTDSSFSLPGDLTVSAWINLESYGGAGGDGIALYTTNEAEGNWALVTNGDLPAFYHRPAGGSWGYVSGNFGAPSAQLPALGTWFHLLFRRSSGTYTVWINGASKSISAFTGEGGGWGQQHFAVGQFYPDPTWSYDGLIDQVAIWSRALSDSEIGQIYNSGDGLPYASWGGGGAALTKNVADPLSLGEDLATSLVLSRAVADPLSLAESVTPNLIADTRPVYFGSASVPVDGAAAVNATLTLTITPPASMLAGDLVAVLCMSRTSGTWTNGVTGGQTWNALTAFAGTGGPYCRIFWCVFNGTWAANPRFDCTVSVCTSAIMHVFRPYSTSHVWAIDVAQASAAYAAALSTSITGLTTGHADAVTLALWTSLDDNTLGTLTGAGWVVTGSPQYRNTSSTDQSVGFAHHIDAGAGSIVPTASLTQLTLGPDAGVTAIVAWYAAPGALTKSLSDAVTMSDLRGGVAAYARSLPEPMTVTELLGKIATYLRSLADPSMTLTEVFDKVLTPGGVELTKNLSDPLTLNELLAKIATLKRSMADPFTITEVLGKSMNFSRSLTDPLTTIENIAAVRALIRSYFDPLNVGDGPVAIKLLVKAFVDSLVLGEALDKQLIMAAYSDTFNRADSSTVGASWNENVSGCAIAGNTLQFQSTGNYSSVVWTQGVAVSAQYQKATHYHNAGTGCIAGFIFRASNTSNGSCYRIIFDTTVDIVYWQNISNMASPTTSTDIGSASFGILPNDTIGITLELTGTNTVVRIWKNPTGLPTRANNWNGDTTPDLTMTQNPATPRDAGTFIGLIGAPLQADVDLEWDDWFGGGCLESTGALFTKDLFDNLLVSEMLGKIADLQRYAFDPLPLSEMFAKAAALQRAVSDTFAIAENPAVKVRALARSYFDSLIIGEALAKQASKKFTDAITLTEAFAKQLVLARALVDPITIGEALVKQPQLRRADTITITENFAKQLQLGRNLSDSITLAELVTKYVGAKNLSDPITLTEAFRKQINRPLSDLLTLSEVFRKDVGKKLSDLLVLNESLVKVFGKRITDPITLTELVGKLKQINKAVSDAITLNEALSKTFVGIKNLSDPLTVSEALSKQLQRRLTDTLAIFGSLENAAQLRRSSVDPLVLTDLLGQVRSWRRSISDTIILTETISKVLVLVRSISNPITISEMLAKSIGFSRSRSDPLALTEAIGKSVGFAKSLPDSMTLTEGLATSAAFRRSMSDLIALTDTGTRQVLRKLLSEPLTISELVTALKITNLFRAFSDPITMTDFVSKLFILLRILSDTLAFTERVVSKASAFHRLRMDPISLSEALGKSGIFGRPLVDFLSLEELLGRIAAYRRSASDPLSLAEALEAARLLIQGRSDAITLSDVVDTTMVIGTLATDRGQHRLIHGRIFSRVN